ncbi:MAG: prepilin-type N-terminal cleavage/methylation domain-containing protein [Candidatus Absconditabacterales bacterium]
MRKKSGFTFIEVIIAITVFAIGVLAVLRLITQNLVTLDITQMRTNATFLAKEGIELVYNMRDSNISKGLAWNCILKKDFATGNRNEIDPETVCGSNFSSGSETNKILQISFDREGYTYTRMLDAGTDFNELFTGNILYYTSGDVGGRQIFRYSSYPAEGSILSFFSRYIVFTGVREGENILPRDSILKVESHVLYNKGSKTGEVVLESFIGNY